MLLPQPFRLMMRVRFPLTAPTKDEKEAVSGIALYVGAFTLTDYPALYCSEIRNYSPVPFFYSSGVVHCWSI